MEITNEALLVSLCALSRDPTWGMAVYHDEIEIEDFEYDEEEDTYFYPCPCGDRFQITKDELRAGEEVATCPSCSLIIKVIYNKDDFLDVDSEKETEELSGTLEKLKV